MLGYVKIPVVIGHPYCGRISLIKYVFLIQIVQKNQDALEAGSTFPDAFYPAECFQGESQCLKCTHTFTPTCKVFPPYPLFHQLWFRLPMV